MPRRSLGAHSFDPKTLSILYAAFDEAAAALQDQVTDKNRQRVHEAVATAIIDLAKAGQLDLAQLKRYATDQGQKALNNVTFL